MAIVLKNSPNLLAKNYKILNICEIDVYLSNKVPHIHVCVLYSLDFRHCNAVKSLKFCDLEWESFDFIPSLMNPRSVFAELLISISSEVVFYGGLLVFLKVTEHVQRPHLVFSSNKWDLITGLKGYLYSSYFTTGFRVFAPLLAVYVVWPAVGLPALISVAPFLFGCAAQFAFEAFLEHRKSSCWPVVPIIFEVSRTMILMC